MLLVSEELSTRAESLWQSWLDADLRLVAPPLFFAEITSVLRERVYYGRLQPEDGDRAFASFTSLDIEAVTPVDLQSRAWELAKRYNLPKAYDAQYLGVATTLGCKMWTADRRLVNAVNEPWLKWVGDYEAAPMEPG